MPTARLLVVEDDDALAGALAALLAAPGIVIEVARNGVQAVARARDLRPAVVLLDVRLPIMDGFEVFRVFRGDPHLRDVRVIFISGHAEPGALSLAKDMGAFACFRKPVDEARLRAKVFAALGIAPEEEPAPEAAGAGAGIPLAPAAAPRPPFAEPRGARRAAVVLVDDDRSLYPIVRELAGEALGLPVVLHQQRTGAAALNHVVAERPDLVLLDLGLPDIEGLRVLRRMKETPALRDLPVVIVSANSNWDTVSNALALGADAYIFKPFNPETFVASVRESCARLRAREG